ncbi:MAG: hypothetical protein COU68_04315 [Candidatus Pacebacteria bacterium CG10_big_fil_rev_8_21_14_0_10_45_6]|nr:MAG: hypothetical protein COU68_04315 [Candidatus Pacebacteria bacterium CG10_big_fil_rev_8_21_14_0_10_45_6]
MGAIDGRKQSYKQIIDVIESLGHSLVTKHVLERQIHEIRAETEAEAELAAKKIQQWIRRAEILVYEVTKPDISIGFEIATAISNSKPVIVLYEIGAGEVPHGLKGVHSEKLQLVGYSNDTLVESISIALEFARETNDIRFNFFVPPSISLYLDWIAQKKKIPRSVYLRTLIEKDRENDEEFQLSQSLT